MEDLQLSDYPQCWRDQPVLHLINRDSIIQKRPGIQKLYKPTSLTLAYSERVQLHTETKCVRKDWR